MSWRSCVVVCLLLFPAPIFAQSTPRVAPLPYDPLELATGPAVVPDTPEKRTAVLALLEHARQNNAMHTPGTAAFSLKASFDSTGNSHETGYGEVEETWLNGSTWRWSARLGDYSQFRIFYNGGAYDDKPHGHMPLRLQMARNAIFWPVVGGFQGDLLRVTTANWQGTDIACILISRGPSRLDEGPGRRWEESEYCVDPKTGLLRMHSEAPGIYSIYDYEGALQFHGRTLPRQITIVESGATVLQIRLESISDADGSLGQFVPTKKMLSHGPGAIMTGPFRFPGWAHTPAGFTGTIHPVIVHALVDEKGKVLDAEVVQTSDAALDSSALEVVWRSNYGPARREGRVQREAFINVKFQ